ncbi:Uncharacterised protein [Vibrio cholerae]|nr:Uncharacterised protein [Vibrio cholerae]
MAIKQHAFTVSEATNAHHDAFFRKLGLLTLNLIHQLTAHATNTDHKHI